MATDPLAQAAMVAACGWDPTAVVTDATVTLSGNDTQSVWLPSLHVTDVSAIALTLPDGSVYDVSIGPGLDVTWGEDGELTWGLGSSMAPLLYWPAGLRNISVTYSGGYSEIPADLQAALDSLTTRMPSLRSGYETARLGKASFTFARSLAAGGLLAVEQMVFDRYRIAKVA